MKTKIATALAAGGATLFFGHALKKMHTQKQENNVTESNYTEFLSKYSKSYATQEEFEFRKAIFADKDAKIYEWNARGDVTHVIGHNEFSDWAEHETQKLRGFKMNQYKADNITT